MSTDPGPDTRIRCPWAVDASGSTLYRDYHDFEWGTPLHGRDELFERICLEAFQAGLSWITVLRKREAFRAGFAGFDVEAVAGFDADDVARLTADPSLLWSFAPEPRGRRVRSVEDVPAITDESTAMSRELKRRGFRFVGPTTAYALMQATGMVDDHLDECWVPRR